MRGEEVRSIKLRFSSRQLIGVLNPVGIKWKLIAECSTPAVEARWFASKRSVSTISVATVESRIFLASTKSFPVRWPLRRALFSLG